MASLKVLTLTASNFEAQVLKSSQPVLVDFWAEWCGPCKMLTPILDELAADYDGKATIGKVDVDAERNLAAQYGIQAMPTLLIFKNGEVSDMIVGLKSKRELKTKLDAAVG